MSTTAIVTGCGAGSGKRSGLMVGLLLLGLASSGIAGDQARTLPRAFQKAQLGMALGDLHRRRTVWQDAQTRITLLEREYFHDGNKALELTLTLSDLELVRLRDLAQDEQVQRKMQEIPIPLSDMELSPGRGARAGVDG